MHRYIKIVTLVAILTLCAFGESEVSNLLVVQSVVPAHHHVLLGLGFFEPFVVVGFQFDQGSQDTLIVVGVGVPE